MEEYDYIRNPKWPDKIELEALADDIRYNPPRTAVIFILADNLEDGKKKYLECINRNSFLREREDPEYEDIPEEIEDILYNLQQLSRADIQEFESLGSVWYGWSEMQT